jgi:hypothetical protein
LGKSVGNLGGGPGVAKRLAHTHLIVVLSGKGDGEELRSMPMLRIE